MDPFIDPGAVLRHPGLPCQDALRNTPERRVCPHTNLYLESLLSGWTCSLSLSLAMHPAVTHSAATQHLCPSAALAKDLFVF